MSQKKYLTLSGLAEYDELIKGEIVEGDASVKSYVDTELAKKANSSHEHNDKYYTESEIDSKISTINSNITNITSGTTVVKKAEYATSAGSATTATSAESATRATQDENGKVIYSTYETKADATNKLDEAKAYADSAAAQVKNDLVNGAGTAYDTLLELGNLIDENKDAIDVLYDTASGKADATHSHEIDEVSGTQTALDGKAASSHGTHVTYSTAAPVMDGTASVGTESTVARSDHKHPTDVSRASQAALDELATTVSGKSDSGHTHTITAAAEDDDVIVLEGINGTNKVTYNASHADSGVTAGTYRSVTVNAKGHVTTGTNPTTLSGYGITDAAPKTHTHAISDITDLQSALTNASTAISANTSSIDAHSDRISDLETKVGDGFEAITSEEIQELFA